MPSVSLLPVKLTNSPALKPPGSASTCWGAILGLPAFGLDSLRTAGTCLGRPSDPTARLAAAALLLGIVGALSLGCCLVGGARQWELRAGRLDELGSGGKLESGASAGRVRVPSEEAATQQELQRQPPRADLADVELTHTAPPSLKSSKI